MWNSRQALSTGHVTWDEYRAKFLASKGFDEKEVAEKIKNNEDLKLDEESKNRKFNSQFLNTVSIDFFPLQMSDLFF